MERSVIIIVCNGEPFVRLQLENVYDLADEIVIAEGADVSFSKIIGSKRSTDGTIESIKKFPDPQKKIKLIHTNCDKNKMSAAANKLCRGKYIYQADIDEFLRKETIEAAYDLLKSGKCDNVRIPERWYYKWYDTYLSSGRPHDIRAVPNRFYRNKIDSGMVISHIPWVGYFDAKGRHHDAHSKPLDKNQHIGHHFLAVYKSHLVRKMRYYALDRQAVTEAIANRKIAEFDAIRREHIGIRKVESYNGHLVLRKDKFDIKAVDDNIGFLGLWEQNR